MDATDYYMLSSAVDSFNNALANAANVYMASNTSKEDRKFSERMTREAWQHNIDLWNMQNEYNLPVNQYARQLEGLRVNGLNPNLVYGSSSSVSGAAGSVSPMNFQGYHATAVPRFGESHLSNIINTHLLTTQIAAQEANTRLINAKADNELSRGPGIAAKSSEAAKRWNTIERNLMENYEESIRGELAKVYWTGVQADYNAQILHYKRDMAFYEAAIAEWLNSEEAPGTGMTYRQYMESCKAFLPGAQFDKLKADVLYIGARMAYLAQQGELLELKKEYQTYVNRLAKYGRSLGNDWVTLLISGIYQLLGKDPGELFKDAVVGTGQTQLPEAIPPTYPGP